MLRAVDISAWQAGINPATLDCDAVIVKATGGTGYVNPYFEEHARATLDSGKLLAFYHFANDDGWHSAREEAEHFLSHVRTFSGQFVAILDWEGKAVANGQSWALEWLEIVSRELGCTPMFYGYAFDVNSRRYAELVAYPLWMASYLDRYDGAGWVDNPDNTWGTGAWPSMTMYQYTSTGRVGGWDGNLDLSVFYGYEGDWNALIGGSGAQAVDTSRIEAMVQHAIDIANDDSHGYSWAERWNIDRDCSSLMYDSADAAGYPVGRGEDKTRYTGTMIDDFTAAGFTKHEYGSLELMRGDILLRDPWGKGGHTEMYIGDGMTVGAHSSETGGVYGEPGDQTGNEISIAPNYGNWDYVLRPPFERRRRKKGRKMECIIRPNGEDYLVYFDGTTAHPLTHPDEATAISEVYRKCNGVDIPIFEYGSKDAPWATRLFEGASRTFD